MKIKLSELLETVESARAHLVKKYGTADEQGNIQVPDDKKEDFYKELNSYLEKEINITIQEYRSL